MKKNLLLGVGLLVAASSFAQDKYSPVIKQGSKLNYSAMVNGQNFPCVFSLDSMAADYVKVGWSVEGFGSGSWVMKSKSLESGNRGFWNQPNPGTQEDLADDQTVVLFSKAQWDMLQKDKKITFDQQTYTVKTPTDQQELKVSGKWLVASRLLLRLPRHLPPAISLPCRTQGPYFGRWNTGGSFFAKEYDSIQPGIGKKLGG